MPRLPAASTPVCVLRRTEQGEDTTQETDSLTAQCIERSTKSMSNHRET